MWNLVLERLGFNVNLYKLTNMLDPDGAYNTYDSVIVAAKSSHAAVRIHPEDSMEWDSGVSEWIRVCNNGNILADHSGSWPYSLSCIVCLYLGKAGASIESGVILSSYNEGY